MGAVVSAPEASWPEGMAYTGCDYECYCPMSILVIIACSKKRRYARNQDGWQGKTFKKLIVCRYYVTVLKE
jgi:hypothetical protein